MDKNKCVKCGKKLRKAKFYNRTTNKIENLKRFVECEKCNIFYKTKDGFEGVDW